jgi:phospholipase/carboxylesterase
VFLHGALRTVDFFVDAFTAPADRVGVIILAPFSTQETWDAILGRFSNDVRVLDAALKFVFERWTIDPARLVLSGFSDGGTYSLAMGRANGDLFSRVVAYSPGFLIGVSNVGTPPILISHGTEDAVLPIAQTSRLIVPALRQAGYTVDYREFSGPHAVPSSISTEVIEDLGPAR